MNLFIGINVIYKPIDHFIKSRDSKIVETLIFNHI